MAPNKEKKYVSDNTLLMAEWDWEKNIESPYSITYGSAKVCFWKCSICGYCWKTPAYSRGSNGCGCPQCAQKTRGNSKRKSFAKKNNFVSNFPEIAKEWHPTKNGKYKIEDVSSFSNIKVWWLCSECGNEWSTTVNHRTKEGNGCPICSRKKGAIAKIQFHAQINNFEKAHPDLAKEWHPFKNGDMVPSDISEHSNIKVWWCCKYCGYEWKTTVNHRSSGQGCPNCSKAQSSFSEQAVYYYVSQVFPDAKHRYKISYEFDIFIPSKKVAIEYDGYFFHSGVDKLEKDNIKDNFCAENEIILIRFRSPRLPDTNNAIRITCEERELKEGLIKLFAVLNCIQTPDINIDRDTIKIQQQFRQLQKGNSIANKYPDLLKEWHPWKNGKMKPHSITYSSSIKCWWCCSKCNFEWQDTPNHRTSRGSGCPLCAGKVVVAGINDLATKNPDVAKEWNFEKNGDLTPAQVSSKSNKKVWWKCVEHRHEWIATISDRTRISHQTNCPYCGNRKILVGFNDLSTTHPQLAKEWNHRKNGDITPEMVTAGSKRKVWWICEKGHEWEAYVYSRKAGTSCPICAGYKLKTTE